MMAGISINILSNVRGAVKGVDDVADALDDAHDTLHDLTKEGDSSSDRLVDDFQRIQRETDRTADEIRKKMRDAYRDTSKASKDTSDDIGNDSRRGFGKASDATKEFKGEALQNVAEVASSFDGSMESIGEVAQGTLGGVSANLGLLGAAAAPAAAAIGLITDAFVKAQEASDEAKESAYEYGLTVAGASEYADTAARINELTGSIEGLKNVQDIATISGLEQKDVLNALATGDGLPALIKAYDEGANSTTIATNRALELQGVLDGTAQGFALSADGANLQAEALYDLATASGTATGEVDALGRKVVELPDGKEIAIDANTRTAYDAITDLENKQIPDKVVNVNTRAIDIALDRLSILQARAAQGITVNARAGQGRFWQ